MRPRNMLLGAIVSEVEKTSSTEQPEPTRHERVRDIAEPYGRGVHFSSRALAGERTTQKSIRDGGEGRNARVGEEERLTE